MSDGQYAQAYAILAKLREAAAVLRTTSTAPDDQRDAVLLDRAANMLESRLSAWTAPAGSCWNDPKRLMAVVFEHFETEIILARAITRGEAK